MINFFWGAAYSAVVFSIAIAFLASRKGPFTLGGALLACGIGGVVVFMAEMLVAYAAISLNSMVLQ